MRLKLVNIYKVYNGDVISTVCYAKSYVQRIPFLGVKCYGNIYKSW